MGNPPLFYFRSFSPTTVGDTPQRKKSRPTGPPCALSRNDESVTRRCLAWNPANSNKQHEGQHSGEGDKGNNPGGGRKENDGKRPGGGGENDGGGGRERGEAKSGGGEGDKNRGGGPSKGGGVDEDGGGKQLGQNDDQRG